jgi:hypothetical protein
MHKIDIKVLRDFPPLRDTTHDPTMSGDLHTEAFGLIATVYAKHCGLEHLGDKLRVSLYHLTPVAFADENGQERQWFGSAVGPQGREAVVTVLVPLDGSHEAMVCNSAAEWMKQFGSYLEDADEAGTQE